MGIFHFEELFVTVIEAVLQVMRESGTPMSPKQVLQAVQSRALYTFTARSPLGIARATMRRHCSACPSSFAATTLYLQAESKDMYSLLPVPIRNARKVQP